MASTSSGVKTPFLVREPSFSHFRPYPQLDGRYEDIAADPKLFMDNLKKLHDSMGTKFMIPIIGGKELDLHRLFLEVTSRGGIEKILRDKKWKEVTAIFNFPSTATNASFVLRKYYYLLLHHFEQFYYFKARGWNPVSGDSPSRTPVSAMGTESPPEFQAAMFQQARTSDAELSGGRTPAATAGSSVIGVIDGKFDSGYLVTVTIGSQRLKGVLYQSTQEPSWQTPQDTRQHMPSSNRNDNVNALSTSIVPGVHRRRRRKKCEIKRRDPAHPKPNRSGYNFFFAEQHARLKPLYPGKDRDISRMIGELWNKLTESERAVYQEKAVKDKERYRIEMEGYRERLRTGQVISDAVPLQQRFPEPDISIAEAEEDLKTKEAEGGDLLTLDNESSSSKSDSEDDGIAEKDCTEGERSREALVGAHSGIISTDTEEASEQRKHQEKLDNVGDEGIEKTAEEREVIFESKENKEEESQTST